MSNCLNVFNPIKNASRDDRHYSLHTASDSFEDLQCLGPVHANNPIARLGEFVHLLAAFVSCVRRWRSTKREDE